MTTSAAPLAGPTPELFTALDTLRLILARLGAERDLDRLYAVTVQEVADFFKATQCALCMRDDTADRWTAVRPAVGLDEAQLRALEAFPAALLAQLLTEWPEPGVLRLFAPEHLRPAQAEVGGLWDERDIWLAQLRGESHILGVLLVANRRDAAPFAPVDIHLLGFVAGQLSTLIQNLRLLLQEQRARRLAETLLQVPQVVRPLPQPAHGARVSAGGDRELSAGLADAELRPVLTRLLRLLSQVIDCSGSMVMLLDGTRLRVIAAYGDPAHGELIGSSWDAQADDKLGEMIESGGPASIGDIRQEARWQILPNTSQIRAWIGAPIWAPGSSRHHWSELIGVLSIDSPLPGVYTAIDVAVAQAFADQMAIVLENQRLYAGMARTAAENARLFEETQLHLHRAEQRTRELALLNQIAIAINSAMNLNVVLDLILSQMQRLVHFDLATIALLDGGELRILGASGFSKDAQVVDRRYRWDRFPLTREVIERCRLITVPDVLRDSRWVPANVPDPARAWMGVPLALEGKAIGVMTLTSLRPIVYSVEDEKLVLALSEQAALAIEKARLLDDARLLLKRAERRSTQLAQVARVSATLSASLELDGVLRNFVNELAAALEVEQVGLVLLDWAAGYGQLVAEYQQEPNQSGANTVIPIAGNSALERVLSTKAPLAIRDAQHDPLLANIREIMLKRSVRSILLLPLIVRGEVIGTIGLDELKAMRDFSAVEIEMAQTLTNQAAAAIANAQLFEDARRRAIQLQTIQEVTNRITAILDVDELPRVAELLVQRFGYYHVHLFVADEAGEWLIARGGSGEAGRALVANHLRLRIGSEGICGYAASTGETLLVNDVQQDVRYRFNPVLAETRAELAVPMKLRGRLVGLLDVESDRVGAFSEADTFLMETLADQVAIALENPRLFGTVQERARQLTVAYDELKELDRMKDEFVQTVSHELRTPLTFIKGYVELLLEGGLGAVATEQADALSIVMERTEGVVHLVNDIISLTRAESMELIMQPVDLVALARAAVYAAGAVTGQAGLRLETDFEENLPALRGDLQRLSQVFDNLLGNAIKFSPNGGTICVRQRRINRMILVEISDQGIGIPADRLERVWDRFYQVDGTTTRRFGGTGLGLAIVKRLVEAHGGEVGVSSVEGEGSTFYFTVPISIPSPITAR